MDASGSKGEGYKRTEEDDLDSYEQLFREFMKRDKSKNFLRKWDGSYDRIMAYPGRYCEMFQHFLHTLYPVVEVSLILLA